MATTVKDPQVGDIVYKVYIPQRPGKIVSLKVDKYVMNIGGLTIDMIGGKAKIKWLADPSKTTWEVLDQLRLLLPLVEETEKKAKNHRSRYIATTRI